MKHPAENRKHPAENRKHPAENRKYPAKYFRVPVTENIDTNKEFYLNIVLLNSA